MDEFPDIEEWAWVEIMLIQAMIGFVSENFRQVMLTVDSQNWNIKFVLKEYNTIDEQAIEEIASDFDNYLAGVRNKMIVTESNGLKQEIIIDRDGFLPNPVNHKVERLIFRRNEHFTGWDDED